MPTPDAAPDRYSVTLKNGEYVFREGESGDALFLVEEGRVELSSSVAPQHTETLDVGDFFGTASLLAERPREISAKAVAPSRLLKIDRATFAEIVRAQPDIAILMLQRVTERAGREDTSPVGATTSHLVHSASGARFPLDGAQFDIGRRAGTVVPAIDLTELDHDKTLSRRHALITRTPAGYTLREEGGRNGTFVNGDRLVAGQQVTLEDGDRVRFGLVELVFKKG